MNCICGHSAMFHDGDTEQYLAGAGGACQECDDCPKFQRDPNWEPPDPPGWEGGFADNH